LAELLERRGAVQQETTNDRADVYVVLIDLDELKITRKMSSFLTSRIIDQELGAWGI
jgi:hypothetical protein